MDYEWISSMFESSVNLYGRKTESVFSENTTSFESSVNSYGRKTIVYGVI